MENEIETDHRTKGEGLGYRLNSLFLKGWHPFFWVVIVAFFLYAKTLAFRLTYLDDSLIILDNYWFLARLENVFKCFLKGVFLVREDAFYRPVLMVSFILNAQIGGVSPFVYHLTNVMIHCCCSALVCVLLLKMSYGRIKAFLLSALFAVHPALSQAVAWIPGRNDSLLALFVLTAFIFLIRYIETDKMRFLIMHMLFCALALFTKETAFIFVPFSVLYFWLLAKEKIMKRLSLFVCAWTLLILFYAAMKHLAVVRSVDPSLNDIRASFSELLPSLLLYIGKSVLPFNLSVAPNVSDSTLVYGFISLLLIAAALLLTPRERLKYSFFGVSWFLIFLIPTFLVTMSMRFEHRLYVPIIGLLIVAAEVGWRKICADKRWLSAASAVIIIGFASITFVHSDSFISRQYFWESAVKTSPTSALTQSFLGTYYQDSGKFELAEKSLKKAIELDPNYWRAHNFLGVLFMRNGDYREAKKELLIADKLNPGNARIYYSCGLLAGNQGKYKDAIRLWEQAIRLNPDYFLVYRRLALYYRLIGDNAKRDFYLKQLKNKFGYGYEISAMAIGD